MSPNQDQVEELEVLQAIYEEDDRFNEINETTVQYRFGELGDNKSFLLEVSWPDDYPECLPDINLDAFYNKHVDKGLKTQIVAKIKEEVADSVGSAMTFTIFQWTGENVDELMALQPETMEPDVVPSTDNGGHCEPANTVKEKKVQLTKQQKRKIADRTNFKGERERGWNWVDIVRHLSKTGSKDEA